MWKFALILIVTVLSVLAAQRLIEASALETHVGAAAETPPLMYGGIRG